MTTETAPCSQCGQPVPNDRTDYAWPMCHACLPPPSPLPMLYTYRRPVRDALLTCIVPWRIVPAKRTNRRDFSPQAKAYHADQKRLADFIAVAATQFERGLFAAGPHDGTVRLGTAVFVGRCKSGPNKGNMPGNIGDWDNYQKAVADCLVYRGWLSGDTARTMRGPDLVLVPKSWGFGLAVESGIYLRPTDATMPDVATVFTLWRTKQ